jgi:hypothetical protein
LVACRRRVWWQLPPPALPKVLGDLLTQNLELVIRQRTHELFRPTAAPTLAVIDATSNVVISRPNAEQQLLCSARVKSRLRDEVAGGEGILAAAGIGDKRAHALY